MSFIFTAEQKNTRSCSLIKRTRLPKRILYIFLFLHILSLSAFAQMKISGVVKNDKGEAVRGVSVNLKQTSIGTTTGQDGKYSLHLSGKGVLVFSHISYIQQEILKKEV